MLLIENNICWCNECTSLCVFQLHWTQKTLLTASTKQQASTSPTYVELRDRIDHGDRVDQANCTVSVVNHSACMALTTVLSQHFCCYLDRCLLDLDFWATISAPRAWTGPVRLWQSSALPVQPDSLQSVHCMVSTPHTLSQIQHGNWTWHLASSNSVAWASLVQRLMPTFDALLMRSTRCSRRGRRGNYVVDAVDAVFSHTGGKSHCTPEATLKPVRFRQCLVAFWQLF